MKKTKQRFFAAIVALSLYFSMLIGTTFAWFADSVTSNSNIIKTGKLDANFEKWNGKSWVDASETSIFDNVNKESDFTQIVNLRVVNNGALAVKWQAVIKTENKLSSLADLINVYVRYDYQNDTVKDYIDGLGRADYDALAKEGEFKKFTLKQFIENITVITKGTMAPGQKSYFSLVLQADESLADEYQELELDGALDILVVTAQLAYGDDVSDSNEDFTLDYMPVSNAAQLRSALAKKTAKIVLTDDIVADGEFDVAYDAYIDGAGHSILRASTDTERSSGLRNAYTGTVFAVKNNGKLTLDNVTLDGGAVWLGEVDATLQRGTVNGGVFAIGNLINTEGDGSIVLNSGAVLQNNAGAHAISLETNGGGSLTLNGAQIINNRSDSGAIWGGGHITVNEGSKINGNSSTGFAGAIRMVGECNITVNGGEINRNKAVGDGGAIWGYGSSKYNFNGGEIAYNEAVGSGGAVYAGSHSKVDICGDFEMHGNKATRSGAICLTDHTSFTMTGGKIYGNTQNGDESNAFNAENSTVNINGGEISDNLSFVGAFGLTIGEANIDGVIYYDFSINYDTVYLASDFNGFSFEVNEAHEHFVSLNFKPVNDYVYTDGDEAKLVCLNRDYVTYWDAATGAFRLIYKK